MIRFICGLLIGALMAQAYTMIAQRSERHGFQANHYAQAEQLIGGRPSASMQIGDATYSTDERGWLYMQGQDDAQPIPVDFRFYPHGGK